MIIAFEGLSCAGKTAVSTELSIKYPKLILLPEFFVSIKDKVSTDLCIANDIAKYTYARILSNRGNHVLMDRSYLSTLAYTYAEGKDKYRHAQSWYEDALNAKSVGEPDLYIYLRIQPEKSLERAASVNRLNLKYAWYNNTKAAYDKFEESFDKDRTNLKSTYRKVDVDNINFKQLVFDVESIINQFIDL